MLENFLQQPCPCGSGAIYDECCGPLLRQERQADTPEQLMRSRYTAYVVGDVDHLFRTWHPRTRPDSPGLAHGATWTGLEIVEAATGESEGIVEFRAHYTSIDGPAVLHERSRFEKRAGRWLYLDGDVEDKLS